MQTFVKLNPVEVCNAVRVTAENFAGLVGNGPFELAVAPGPDGVLGTMICGTETETVREGDYLVKLRGGAADAPAWTSRCSGPHFDANWRPEVPFEHGQAFTQVAQSNTLRCRNYHDDSGNPSGGYCHGTGICIAWQDGPRGKDESGNLAPANGAFVEDALVAARQRLMFFQQTKFNSQENGQAIEHIDRALEALAARAHARAERGVLGQNTV